MLSLHTVPLPIFQKINSQKELIMFNYSLSLDMLFSLANALTQMIPETVTKIYFVNNSLDDLMMQEVFSCLQKVKEGGLSTIVLAKNGIGSHTIQKMVEYMKMPGFLNVKKLVIKEPISIELTSDLAFMIPDTIKHLAPKLTKLKKLTLSGLELRFESF